MTKFNTINALQIEKYILDPLEIRSNASFVHGFPRNDLTPREQIIFPNPALVLLTGARSIHDVVTGQPTVYRDLNEAMNYAQEVCKEPHILLEHGGHRSLKCPERFPHLRIIPHAAIPEKRINGERWRWEHTEGHRSIEHFYRSRRGPGEYTLVSNSERTLVTWSGEDRLFPEDQLERIISMARQKYQEETP